MKRYFLMMAIMMAVIFATFSIASADYTDLVINEINYNPPSGQTMDDLYYEFIEIYNNGPDLVDLQGFFISNYYSDPTGDTLYIFQMGASLAAGDFLIIAERVDSMTSSSHYSVPSSKVFGQLSGTWYQGNLGNTAGSVKFFNQVGVMIDSVYYYDGPENGWPTAPDNAGPTCELINPNLDNTLGASWLASVDPNPASPGSPAAINTVYQAGNQSPIIANVVNVPQTPGVGVPVEVSANITDPALIASVASASLYYDAGLGYNIVAMSNAVDSFYATIPGQSEGTTVNYYLVAKDDLGDSTVSSTYSYFVTSIVYQFGDVIVNEVMYSPPGSDTYYEWVELYNPNPTDTINMSNWAFSDNANPPYTIPPGTFILPQDYVVVSSRPDSFAFRYPSVIGTVVGPFMFGLNNPGDDVRLRSANGTTIDSVAYLNGGTWPVTGTGGPSIELKNETYPRNDGNSWAGSLDTLGTPMAINSTWEPGDIVGPDANPAYATGQATVRVHFSESVEETSAENPANYALFQAPNQMLTVYSATLDNINFNTVDLVTAPMTNGAEELLVVSGIFDLNGNVMPGPDTLYFRGGYTKIITVQTPVNPGVNDTSAIFGEMVTVRGVVTCDSTDLTTSGAYWYFEDTSYTFAYGIKVYSGTNKGVKKGDYVTVAGTVAENFGETEIDMVYFFNPTGFQFDESAVYPAKSVPSSECKYNGVLSEKWEGCLIRLFNMQLVADSFGFYSNNLLFVNMATGADSVEMQKFPYAPVYTIGNAYTITGIMSYSHDHYLIRYRGDANDILANYTAAMIGMEPINPPVQTTSPGSFRFNGHLVNTAGLGWINDVWVQVELPNAGPRITVANYANINVPAYSSITFFNVPQPVPPGGPLGTYLYVAFVGDYPNAKIDSAYFNFAIVASIAGEGEWVGNDWRNYDKEIEPLADIPTSFGISQNYPNPFNAATTINYQLPSGGNVTLEIYNLMGQKVATLINGQMDAGYHSVNWDASQYSSGVYFYKLAIADRVFTKRMTLLK